MLVGENTLAFFWSIKVDKEHYCNGADMGEIVERSQK